MDPSPLSALSADDLGCIMRAALAADGSTRQARLRLSLVCRRWRDSLRDAPLDKHFEEKWLTPKQLLASLASTCFASVRLYYSYDDEQWPPALALPPMIVTALAWRSALTLTALHHLPLVEPWVEPGVDPWVQPDTGLGLAALTQLRALTLRQTWEDFAELRAEDLPPSLEDLTLVMQHPHQEGGFGEDLPAFVAFDRLQNLRRIALSEYVVLELRWHPALLPPSLEVLRIDNRQEVDLHRISGMQGPPRTSPAGLTLEVCSDQISINLTTDGGVVARDGGTTALPQGFTALRMQATRLICRVTKRLAHVGSEPQRFCTGNAVHLLCRALRLAPTCYRHFSLAAHPRERPCTRLRLVGVLKTAGDEPGSNTNTYLHDDFGSSAGLTAAMGQFAAVEGLSVQLSLDASCVIVRRAAGGAAEVQ